MCVCLTMKLGKAKADLFVSLQRYEIKQTNR